MTEGGVGSKLWTGSKDGGSLVVSRIGVDADGNWVEIEVGDREGNIYDAGIMVGDMTEGGVGSKLWTGSKDGGSLGVSRIGVDVDGNWVEIEVGDLEGNIDDWREGWELGESDGGSVCSEDVHESSWQMKA